MREFKFRGYSTKDNEWRYGFYVTDNITHEILTKLENNEMYASQIDFISLGKYTGFKIKNIEIYENDIIRARKDYLYKVVFENGSFVLYHLNKYDGQELIRWGLLSRLFDSDMKDILEESEIIGNIYENQELLEDK